MRALCITGIISVEVVINIIARVNVLSCMGSNKCAYEDP